MMDIGLDSPDDWKALESIAETIGAIGYAADAVLGDPPRWDDPSTDIGCLMAGLTSRLPLGPTIDPRWSIRWALATTRDTLDQIIGYMANGIRTTPEVLQILGRSALLGAGRVVFMLGPEEADTRLENTITVISQEGDSIMRAYRAFGAFEQLAGLVPPRSTVEAQEARHAAAHEISAGRLGEQGTLKRMAEVIGDLMVESGYEDDPRQMITEHATWIFNTFSGVAHAYGWPQLVPRTESMTGVFIADLTLIVNAARLAFDCTQARLEPTDTPRGKQMSDSRI